MSEKLPDEWERVLRTVPIVKGVRKVKVERADGTIDERDAADLLSALVERQGLEVAVREGALPIEIQRRRAAGLPDLCATCGKAMGMSVRSVSGRSTDPTSWMCAPCKGRLFWESLSAEQRSSLISKSRERARSAIASLTWEQRKERAAHMRSSITTERRREIAIAVNAMLTAERRREIIANRTPEQRSESARKGNASRTPEQRSESARKARATMTPEQRSESARKAARVRMDNTTPEQRSESARKASRAALENTTPEQRSESARRAQSALTPEQRSENVRKSWETRKAKKEVA